MTSATPLLEALGTGQSTLTGVPHQQSTANPGGPVAVVKQRKGTEHE